MTLSDADTIWTKIRHLHMQEAIETLMKDFNQFLEENAGFRGCGGFFFRVSVWNSCLTKTLSTGVKGRPPSMT